MKRDGVVEAELRRVFEHLRDSVPAEVPMKWTRYVGEHEGNIVCQCFGEHGGQSRQHVIGADSNARDSAIGEDENGSDGVDVLLELIRNTFLVNLILLETASIGQSRCIEDADLDNWVSVLIVLTNITTYYYAILARKFVKTG